jgi:hypothetical protein
MSTVDREWLNATRDALRFRTKVYVTAITALALIIVVSAFAPRLVILAVPMAGYGLPVCATEDSTPVGGCVWRTADAVLINHPGRT